MVKEVGRKLIAQNKKARHDYSIEDVYECGVVLTGTEVKSLRAGRASLVDGFATFTEDELFYEANLGKFMSGGNNYDNINKSILSHEMGVNNKNYC